MPNYNKQTLITFFEQNDVPQGTDYANLITSQVNLVETSAQAMAGPLQTTELIASRVSAGNINATGTLAAATLTISTLSVSAMIVSGKTTTESLVISTQTSANNVNISGDLIRPVATYAAAGTAQATAQTIVANNAILTGATDGQATGYILLGNRTGLVQHIYNQNTVSANLWPCVGGQINVLASNAAFGMAASTMYTVLHTKASGYAVK